MYTTNLFTYYKLFKLRTIIMQYNYNHYYVIKLLYFNVSYTDRPLCSEFFFIYNDIVLLNSNITHPIHAYCNVCSNNLPTFLIFLFGVSLVLKFHHSRDLKPEFYIHFYIEINRNRITLIYLLFCYFVLNINPDVDVRATHSKILILIFFIKKKA